MQRLVEIAEGRYAHASGALWFPESRIALVADVHLGYGWAQRRRGELGPVVDGGAAAKLAALLDELAPAELVVIGDLVHAPKPAPAERDLIARTLAGIAGRCRITLVPGNHDRGFAGDFPSVSVRLVDEWRAHGVVARHGHEPARACGTHVVLGHIHPAYAVFDDAGAAQKIPVFVAGASATILPAFSPLAGGVSLGVALTAEVRDLLGRPVRIIAASGRRAVELGPISALR